MSLGQISFKAVGEQENLGCVVEKLGVAVSFDALPICSVAPVLAAVKQRGIKKWELQSVSNDADLVLKEWKTIKDDFAGIPILDFFKYHASTAAIIVSEKGSSEFSKLYPFVMVLST